MDGSDVLDENGLGLLFVHLVLLNRGIIIPSFSYQIEALIKTKRITIINSYQIATTRPILFIVSLLFFRRSILLI